ncbi:dihydrolipoyl dehydrogenase [Mobilitalea sibirica]|uniref:Dihydrolipoyl dehydrogenase n=1 Tax=Mobilitalea sibirica TaxID=1462919 RepID=A0A8J7L284_9FIRM|nr:dihydrolipoyl dehydrogenase [Mobilitalea sibirica]MBH1940103.1 dihydrolipoyl dehydrogenase [Mobilitalea sibirica]
MDQYNLIVIGSGPGGYVAAIKAAKLGMKTALIESGLIGGTCLNRGCIPTKTLMHSSHLFYEASALQDVGITYTGLSIDYTRMQMRKDEVVDKIRNGITGLLKANGVTIYQGTAVIKRERRVLVKAPEEERTLKADHILIATGSRPIIPKIEGVHLENVVTSDNLLSSDGKLYQKLLIIGGGVIGVEFATLYRELGCEVTIIEAMERILPNMDKEISRSIAMGLKKMGVNIHTGTKVLGITKTEHNELCCEYEEKEVKKQLSAKGILLSVGRRANTDGLFDPEINIEFEGPSLRVNTDFETSYPGVYAIGDVIKGMQLAHVASAQGIIVVETMCGKKPSLNLSAIPSCIYTSPEVAVVGMNEEEAVSQGYRIKIGKYPMLGNSKTILSSGERGFIKVICEEETGQILGAQLLCDRATDMIGEFTTAIANGLNYHDLASVVRPHPTYNEAVSETVEDVEGMAIHLLPRQR